MQINPFVTNHPLWSVFIFLFLYLILELFFSYRFLSTLNKPIGKSTRSVLSFDESKEILDLYKKYRSLQKEEYKQSILYVKSRHFEKDIMEHLIDLISKLLFGLVIAMMAFAATVNTATLTFLNNNDELKNSNFTSWQNSILETFTSFSKGMDAYSTVIVVSMIFFTMAAIRFLLLDHRKSILKQHLTAIEQLEKERNQK